MSEQKLTAEDIINMHFIISLLDNELLIDNSIVKVNINNALNIVTYKEAEKSRYVVKINYDLEIMYIMFDLECNPKEFYSVRKTVYTFQE